MIHWMPICLSISSLSLSLSPLFSLFPLFSLSLSFLSLLSFLSFLSFSFCHFVSFPVSLCLLSGSDYCSLSTSIFPHFLSIHRSPSGHLFLSLFFFLPVSHFRSLCIVSFSPHFYLLSAFNYISLSFSFSSSSLPSLLLYVEKQNPSNRPSTSSSFIFLLLLQTVDPSQSVSIKSLRSVSAPFPGLEASETEIQRREVFSDTYDSTHCRRTRREICSQLCQKQTLLQSLSY